MKYVSFIIFIILVVREMKFCGKQEINIILHNCILIIFIALLIHYYAIMRITNIIFSEEYSYQHNIHVI